MELDILEQASSSNKTFTVLKQVDKLKKLSLKITMWHSNRVAQGLEVCLYQIKFVCWNQCRLLLYWMVSIPSTFAIQIISSKQCAARIFKIVYTFHIIGQSIKRWCDATTSKTLFYKRYVQPLVLLLLLLLLPLLMLMLHLLPIVSKF